MPHKIKAMEYGNRSREGTHMAIDNEDALPYVIRRIHSFIHRLGYAKPGQLKQASEKKLTLAKTDPDHSSKQGKD